MPDKVKETHSMHMLFGYKFVEDKLEQYYQNWIKNKEVLQPIYNLYFGIVYNQHLYLEQKFLALIQAAESFHRRTSSLTDLNEDEHKERITKITESTPSEHKEWLMGKLTYSNELTLRKRLKNLLEEFPQSIDDYSIEKDPCIQLILNTRNYLTHYDKKLETKKANTKQMFELYQRLMLLVEACLLSKLGFEKEKITTLIEQSKFAKGIKK